MNFIFDRWLMWHRWRWVIIVALGTVLLAVQCSTSSEKMVSELKMPLPAGTPVVIGQEVTLWVDTINLVSPVYIWRVSLSGQTIKEEQGNRSFSFLPDEPGIYEISLVVADGKETFRLTPVSIPVSEMPTFTPTHIPVATPTSVTETLTYTPTSSTSTPTPTPTALSPIPTMPSPTPTMQKAEAVVVWEGSLNLRSGPGIIYDIMDFLSKDEILDIEGRIASNEWIKIVSVVNPDKIGWTSALPQYVQINVDLDSIPIVEVPPTPTPRSTPTPTSTPTPVLLPAPIPKWPLTDENARQIQTVEVKWEWTGRPLANDEWFSVNIEPQGFLCPAGPAHTQFKETTFRSEMNCPSGRYAWYVKLVVRDETSPTGWHELSYPSPTQYFDFARPPSNRSDGNGGPCVPPLCP